MVWWQWVLGVWAVSGLVLWRFPWLIHKPKRLRRDRRVWAIAHRGGSAEQPENTLAAFHNAVRLGCDMLEMDVQCTRDGHIVISHDNHLERITGKSEYISQLTYKELPVYAHSFESHFLPQMCDFEGEFRLATLEAVFQAFPSTFMCIDIKNPDPYTIATTVALIRKYSRQHLTVTFT